MKRNYVTVLLLIADLGGALFSFWLGYWLRYQTGIFPHGPYPLGFSSMFYGPLLAVGLWALILLLFESHRSPSGLNYSLGFSNLITPYFFFVAAFLAVFFADRILFSRLQLGIFFVAFYFSLLLIRTLSRHFLLSLRYYGIGLRRVAIVGDSELGQDLAQRIQRHPEFHYEVAGFLFPAAGATVRQDSRQTLVGNSEFIAQELASQGISELIFVIPIRKDSETLDFIATCQKQGITVKLVPEYYEMHSHQIESLSIDGIPLLELKDLSPNPAYRMLKRLMDLGVSGSLLLLLSPLMLLIAILLWMSDDGGVFKAEQRIGVSGRPFRMHRFRVDPASTSQRDRQSWGPRFRAFLYRYSLSETPQFWNVLKGDMSLVGPRPESPEQVRHYSAWHQRRLLLKPGMTGLAQVRGLRAVDSLDEKTRYDLEYAANLSPFLDVRLLFATLGTLAQRARKQSAPKPPLQRLKLSGGLGEKRV
jgi:exopolysaccharide biosynthesis polyprenyl glycosylphosphotransferase